jgi:hypothetical protein
MIIYSDADNLTSFDHLSTSWNDLWPTNKLARFLLVFNPSSKLYLLTSSLGYILYHMDPNYITV